MKCLAALMLIMSIFFLPACSSSTDKTGVEANITTSATLPMPTDSLAPEPVKTRADNAIIMARKQVPVLCYHGISGRSGSRSIYNVSPVTFESQIKVLADSGYQTILPDQLYNYLAYGDELPQKPVMISFDDTRVEQFSTGAAALEKHGFRGVFFIMTIALDKPHYMSGEQVKTLSANGHVIACHTWDHHRVTNYTADDWEIQLAKPQQRLEKIIGKPVRYFAYPFGLWNSDAFSELKQRDYKLAFILSGSRDSTMPLYTVRRMIVPSWTPERLIKIMHATFQ